MALKKIISLEAFGQTLSFPNAYIKVTNIAGNKDSLTAAISYFDKQNGLFLKVASVNFAPELNGNNFISQAYNHIKSLSEFADAVDC